MIKEGVYHKKEIQIYYHYTDAGGVIYYGRYANILEEARVDFFEKEGFNMRDISNKGYIFTVIKLEQIFKQPIFYSDRIICETKLIKKGRLKMIFEQKIFKINNEDYNHLAKITLGTIDKNFKPKIIDF